MTLYNWIKITHIIMASALFGIGVGGFFYLIWINLKKDIAYLVKNTQQILVHDWIFISIAGVVQPITGFAMIYVKGCTLPSHWWDIILLCYCFAVIAWFVVIYLQMRCRDMMLVFSEVHGQWPKQYFRCFVLRCIFSLLALFSLVVMFYFMTSFPCHTPGSPIYNISNEDEHQLDRVRSSRYTIC